MTYAGKEGGIANRSDGIEKAQKNTSVKEQPGTGITCM